MLNKDLNVTINIFYKLLFASNHGDGLSGRMAGVRRLVLLVWTSADDLYGVTGQVIVCKQRVLYMYCQRL